MAQSTATNIVQRHANAIVCVQCISRKLDWTQPFLSRTTQSSTGTGFIIDLGRNTEVRDGRNLGPDVVQQLYKDVFPGRTPRGRGRSMTARFVLTCAHCVENSNVGDITVTFPMFGVTQFDAVVVKFCPDIDTALLLVFIGNEHDIKCNEGCSLTFGRSEGLKPGEPVISIGFPLGGNIKTTQGTFSGFEGTKGIQHTSPISPGNSGGPLINMRGEVVGINYQGVVSAAVSNVHYAQPSELIQQMLEDVSSKVAHESAQPDKTVAHRRENIGVCFQNTLPSGGETCEEGGVLVYHYEDVAVQSILKHTVRQAEEPRREALKEWLQARIGAKKKVPFNIRKVSWSTPAGSKFYCIRDNIEGTPIDCNNQVSANLQNQVLFKGEGDRVPTDTRIKIHLSQLFRRLPTEATICLQGQFIDHDSHPPPEGTDAPIKLFCKKNFVMRGARAFMWYPYDDSAQLEDHFLCAMGMCVMEMTLNHVVRFRNLQAMQMSNKKMNDRRIIITYIFPNTDASRSRILQPGDTICSVNGVDVYSEINKPEMHGKNIVRWFKDRITEELRAGRPITLTNQEQMRLTLSVEDIAEAHAQNIIRGDYQNEMVRQDDGTSVLGEPHATLKEIYDRQHLEAQQPSSPQ